MADNLSNQSRDFYERTRSKMILSMLVGAAGLLLLGFCSFSGGQAAKFSSYVEEFKKRKGTPNDDFVTEQGNVMYPVGKTTDDTYIESALNAQSGGYGFASFAYIVGAVLLFFAAVYISPLLCGSVFEKKMVWSGATEIEPGYAKNMEEAGDDL